ncbi:UDP-N-acetylglucosamine--peptide N-acetylglucosaminyltransferase GtfA subunit [Flavobacterium bizetiae]|uniref:UDP-N-acetylglucosamine--peptide N-acetylglucosaminyltransferase GtfA subunit n=1 Tax=Flavobacterium bizetiae TaxID=2704140 RepID=A0A6J4GXM4_9FLAO|nr:glycosyltransferase family 4 protein [Flavobacterium bizetiae]CAA9203662.1 UDP-N-acetylglucosamine--peptide N-acetylglucosaminyltransferase GtfA subunit [Flavobacterium bizetiae]CAD5344532.1 UDP-N-acetylglucosamine--peptide N-acetylglucosaminyltransferase GtfA subunit [Flavobacterium bizetiae]CAD5350601.1 UDP-N-acetylglucosamine--peptide N-acetylglucosaminyltransferase GtfA subunit [Flavobacterium bizetiae]
MSRIAIICNYQLLPERVGGMDYFFWDFDKKCKENNIEIDWFFPNKSSHGNYSNMTIYNSEVKSVEKSFLSLYKKSEPNYTHIITHFIELCTPFFYKIKKLSHAKIIAVDHNPRPLYGYPLKKRINKKLKGILFSRYIDFFVGVSNYTVNEILKDFGSHLKSKTLTIYNGVILDAIVEREKRATQKPSFLVASHLRESKGIQDLIEAVYLLPIEIKTQIEIVIYGDGPYKQQLLEKIEKYSLCKCFIFMGSKPNLNEIFSQYDYMLQPTHMECFSLSILESLAANVPVITTNVGGNIEAITSGKNGYVFKAKNLKDLTQIIKDIYLGDKKISINTRELIANSFSLPKMVENHFELLKTK